MFISILLFVIGLFLLIKGGDIFVDGSVGIARQFRLPELVIGATVVSLGTTLPEVSVSVISAFNGHGELSYGNAIGSVICNTALIAAISISVKPGKVDRKSFLLPVIFFLISAVIYSFTAYYWGSFGRVCGTILLAVFLIYFIITVKTTLNKKDSVERNIQRNLRGNDKITLVKDFIFLIIGAVIIAIGSNLLVDNGIKISEIIGIPESVIALTFVALGTSLPEFVTAITALAKGHGALSLGNIVGANLLNIVLVSGLSMIVSPFNLPEGTALFGINSSLVLDIPLLFIAMLIMTLPALIKEKHSRYQGVLLLILYISFCVVQFIL